MNVSRRFHNNQKNFTGQIGAKYRRLKVVPMVFSGKKRGGGDRDPAEEDMERLKRLHNFNLPYLKWGNQKLLRCMKVDSIVDRNHSSESVGGGSVIGTRRRDLGFQKRFRSTDDDRKTESKYKFSSLESGGDGTGGGGTRLRDSEFEKRFRSSDDVRKTESNNRKVSSSEKGTARIRVAGVTGGVTGDGEISATREKLMIDFQKEVGDMKNAILRDGLVDPPPAATTTASFSPPADRPWNLRTRRAACKAPRSPTNGVDGNGNSNGDVLKPNFSPLTNGATTSGEKNERPKFSVSLSRRELEDDFMTMAGRRLPRKPKKRPRIVQKQLDTLFPGLWLSEITADLYKVPDETDTGKR